jgi:hypothetical protein
MVRKELMMMVGTMVQMMRGMLVAAVQARARARTTERKLVLVLVPRRMQLMRAQAWLRVTPRAQLLESVGRERTVAASVSTRIGNTAHTRPTSLAPTCQPPRLLNTIHRTALCDHHTLWSLFDLRYVALLLYQIFNGKITMKSYVFQYVA